MAAGMTRHPWHAALWHALIQRAQVGGRHYRRINRERMPLLSKRAEIPMLAPEAESAHHDLAGAAQATCPRKWITLISPPRRTGEQHGYSGSCGAYS